jgi:hypothetical protein
MPRWFRARLLRDKCRFALFWQATSRVDVSDPRAVMSILRTAGLDVSYKARLKPVLVRTALLRIAMYDSVHLGILFFVRGVQIQLLRQQYFAPSNTSGEQQNSSVDHAKVGAELCSPAVPRAGVRC